MGYPTSNRFQFDMYAITKGSTTFSSSTMVYLSNNVFYSNDNTNFIIKPQPYSTNVWLRTE